MRKKDMFTHARIRLTIFYTLILGVILFAFSAVLIFTVESKVRTGLREHIVVTNNNIFVEDDPLERTSDEIEIIIYIVDALLLIGIGFSSYFLAGKTLEPIKKALDAQKKFSADASHDLRTPLAIITTESEVVLKNNSSTKEELTEALTSNLEEAKKMSRLVEDLLTISREDIAQPTQHIETVDLYHFIQSIADRFKNQAQAKHVRLAFNPPHAEVFCSLDTHLFGRAVSNILHNAVKYTDQGSIGIDIKENKNTAVIVIQDTGKGISEKDLPYVFDRFYKAEHSRSDTTSFGLGLSIAKQIVEQHGGYISIDSTPTIGTKVTITFSKV